MCTQAKLTLQYSYDHYRNMGDVSDAITLYNVYFGHPYRLYSDVIAPYNRYSLHPCRLSGVIHMIVGAYDYAVSTKRFLISHDELVAFATSLILISKGDFEPSTRDGYEQIKMGGCFWEPDYWYKIVLFPETDQDNDPFCELTVSWRLPSAVFTSIKRSLKEWRRYAELTAAYTSMVQEYSFQDINNNNANVNPEIESSIYLKEANSQILADVYRNLGPCPCDECIVRASCIETLTLNGGGKYRRMHDKCDKKVIYEGRVTQWFPGLLSYDSELDKLFKESIS